MVMLNNEHINTVAADNGFGGAMCGCADCKKKRMSDTPRTDATNHIVSVVGLWVHENHAKQLELELNEARKMLKEYHQNQCVELMKRVHAFLQPNMEQKRGEG